MKKLSYYAMALFMGVCTTLSMSSCSDSDDSNDDENLSAQELLMEKVATQYVNDVVKVTYSNLGDETQSLYEKLETAKNNFKNDPTSVSQADIDDICETFIKARAHWEDTESFLFGAATDFGIDPHIDTWPLDVDGLATCLRNKTQLANLDTENPDDAISYAANKLGQELLGFHGIEFIIFRNGANRTIEALRANETDAAFSGTDVNGEEELIYAAAVAGDLRDRCWQLQVAWDKDAPAARVTRVADELELPYTVGSGSNTYDVNMLNAGKAGSTYASWREVMSTILIAGCSGIADEVANTKMGQANSGEDVNYIESPYSKRSFIDFKDNILSIKHSLYGTMDDDATAPTSTSLMYYLQTYNSSEATALNSKLNAALSALDTCINSGTSFVDNPKAACVDDAMDAVNALNDEINVASSWIVRN